MATRYSDRLIEHFNSYEEQQKKQFTEDEYNEMLLHPPTLEESEIIKTKYEITKCRFDDLIELSDERENHDALLKARRSFKHAQLKMLLDHITLLIKHEDDDDDIRMIDVNAKIADDEVTMLNFANAKREFNNFKRIPPPMQQSVLIAKFKKENAMYMKQEKDLQPQRDLQPKPQQKYPPLLCKNPMTYETKCDTSCFIECYRPDHRIYTHLGEINTNPKYRKSIYYHRIGARKEKCTHFCDTICRYNRHYYYQKATPQELYEKKHKLYRRQPHPNRYDGEDTDYISVEGCSDSDSDSTTNAD